MTARILILESAERDLKELRRYILANFSADQWRVTYTGIKEAIRSLRSFPQSGVVPAEIAQLGLNQYRQVLSGKNRIIYELRLPDIYIHVIADMRRDMATHLSKRLLERE